MHVRAIFCAAMCMYFYATHKSPESAAGAARDLLDFEEHKSIGPSTAQLFTEVNGNKPMDSFSIELNGACPP